MGLVVSGGRPSKRRWWLWAAAFAQPSVSTQTGTQDTDVLTEIQYALLEDPDGGLTWPSGLWTRAEVLAALNQRQHRFMKSTGLMAALSETSVASGTLRPPQPEDWIATLRASWQSPGGSWWPLAREGSWEYDQAVPTWPTANANTHPQAYMDAEAGTLAFQLAPVPREDGTLRVLYISLCALLDGNGELFTVPDEFVPAIKYGTLADLLRKFGRGQDLDRADYCELRFEEGVAIGRQWIDGWGV